MNGKVVLAIVGLLALAGNAVARIQSERIRNRMLKGIDDESMPSNCPDGCIRGGKQDKIQRKL